MSLPAQADSVVNCSPVSCMPSPESPANRTTARFNSLNRLAAPVRGAIVSLIDRPLSTSVTTRQTYDAVRSLHTAAAEIAPEPFRRRGRSEEQTITMLPNDGQKSKDSSWLAHQPINRRRSLRGV